MNTQNQKNENKSEGRLIVICGGEGSGKSSVRKGLESIFSNTVFTREPGGTPYAEAIRDNIFKHPLAKDANAETIFGQMWASRAEHMNHLVLPAIRSGNNVISDRFECCTFAYQIKAQGASHLEKLFWHTREVFLRDKVPDLYIFLDVSPEEGLKRVAGRKGDTNHFDEREITFHRAVREGYLDFFQKIQALSERDDLPHGAKSNFIVIDAGKSLEEVQMEVIKTVEGVLK